MAKYKPDQGPYARTSALWLLGALCMFGCTTLYYWLLSFRGEPDGTGVMVKPLMEGNLPVLGIPLTVALLVAVGLAGLCLWMLMRMLDRPKVADMLIDSETEMRKCTWPTWDETLTSSVVILVVMVAFTGLLAGMDISLNWFMTTIVFS
ncbi:MAG: preprotein translocase subunit SecE [Planctomycetota bacterium]|nr:MAG: preprotein translocase subunit SecE [Planctomycetota bacterium]